MSDNTCGTCYACCVHLGIEALQKYAGQACRHLSGADPEKRCTIYPDRPRACSTYKCLFLQSDAPIEFRPDNSGLLVTLYANGPTIQVIDPQKAGALDDPESKLNMLLQRITLADEFPHEEIRIFNLKEGRGFIVKDGRIFLAKSIPPEKGDYEGLTYAALSDQPVGRVVILPTQESVK